MKINVHYPNSQAEWSELACRVAEVYADATIQSIEKLSCSNKQKLALLNAVIAVKKQEYRGFK